MPFNQPKNDKKQALRLLTLILLFFQVDIKLPVLDITKNYELHCVGTCMRWN